MAKVNLRAVIIFAVLFLMLAAIGVVLYLQDRAGENTANLGLPDPIVFYADSDIPSSFREKFVELCQDRGWVEAGNIEMATVFATANPDRGYTEGVYYHQMWVVTKPWGELAQDDIGQIGRVSDKIQYENLDMILDGRFELDPDVGTFQLSTLQELDANRLAVKIDGKNPLDDRWWWMLTSAARYPLVFSIYIHAPEEELDSLISDLDASGVPEQFDFIKELPSDLDIVSVVHTGTSVAGGPGWPLCERNTGTIDFPIATTRDFLHGADLTIISNESSFVDGCTQAGGTTSFCGDPRYMQNLLDIGVDVISLTGNHMCDYGREAFVDTMNLYTTNGIKYFASGNNSTEAWTPLYVETEAGTIAFVGYNNMGPGGVIATEELAGTAYYDQTLLASALSEARQNSDIVWVDNQLWPEYGTDPGTDQVTLGRESIEGGADIVTGVGSHEIQAAEFYNSKPVFWGLGNFYFDQMAWQETRQGIVLRAYLYDGKIRDIEVHPTLMYDYCQPRFAEGEEKTQLLQYFIDISGF